MIISGIHHVQIGIPKGKEHEAEAFYCGILGLKPIQKPDNLLGRGGLWLQAGDREVHLGIEDGVDRSKTRAHIAYEVEDVTALKEMLKTHGMEPVDSIPIPGYERFETRDPFGNRLEFIQRKQ